MLYNRRKFSVSASTLPRMAKAINLCEEKGQHSMADRKGNCLSCGKNVEAEAEATMRSAEDLALATARAEPIDPDIGPRMTDAELDAEALQEENEREAKEAKEAKEEQAAKKKPRAARPRARRRAETP